MRGATTPAETTVCGSDFNPRSSCEERLCFPPYSWFRRLFQSTLLMRGATLAELTGQGSSKFQSTLLMRGATAALPAAPARCRISIHAPHARSDHASSARLRRNANFNPRSSCEERPLKYKAKEVLAIFQSTLLMRGATKGAIDARKDDVFQSTLLMRGATYRRLCTQARFSISIHAPHARSDRIPHDTVTTQRNFNPRSSCEERRTISVTSDANYKFQSTLLMRGATVSILGIDLPDFIIYFSRTYPISPKMPTSRHLSCKLHFLCDGTSHFGDL